MSNDVIIKRVPSTGANKNFIFRGVSRFTPKKVQPSIAIPLINTDAASNLMFRFQGQTEEVSFDFAMWDDGTDISQGTNTSTVVTVSEQEKYLKDTIYSYEFDTKWELWNPDDLVYETASPITGVIDRLEFGHKSGAQTVVTGSITFKRGTLVSLASLGLDL